MKEMREIEFMREKRVFKRLVLVRGEKRGSERGVEKMNHLRKERGHMNKSE